VGKVLPMAVQNSLGVGLYALFMAILVPEMKKDNGVLLLAALSGLVYLLIDRVAVFSSGWSLIAAIIAAAAMGVLVLKDTLGEGQG